MAAPTLKELKQLVAHLEGLRSKRLAQQWEIGKLILPSRGLFQGEETECLRDANLLNPAAQRALGKAAAGMTQAITPASSPWFRHQFLDRADREVTGGNEYVDVVDARIRAVLAAGGFYSAIHAFNLLAARCSPAMPRPVPWPVSPARPAAPMPWPWTKTARCPAWCGACA